MWFLRCWKENTEHRNVWGFREPKDVQPSAACAALKGAGLPSSVHIALLTLGEAPLRRPGCRRIDCSLQPHPHYSLWVPVTPQSHSISWPHTVFRAVSWWEVLEGLALPTGPMTTEKVLPSGPSLACTVRRWHLKIRSQLPKALRCLGSLQVRSTRVPGELPGTTRPLPYWRSWGRHSHWNWTSGQLRRPLWPPWREDFLLSLHSLNFAAPTALSRCKSDVCPVLYVINGISRLIIILKGQWLAFGKLAESHLTQEGLAVQWRELRHGGKGNSAPMQVVFITSRVALFHLCLAFLSCQMGTLPRWGLLRGIVAMALPTQQLTGVHSVAGSERGVACQPHSWYKLHGLCTVKGTNLESMSWWM